jgi:Ca2+-dependent lipid-binding protein
MYSHITNINVHINTIQISRVRADFQIEIFDWNQLEQAKSLGTAKINLEDIEPLTATERTLTLSSEKRGAKGQITIRMVFQPEIIMRARKSTSTFSAAGRTMTAIGTAPISAGRGVLHGVTSVFKRGNQSEDGHNISSLNSGLSTVPESKAVSDISATQVSQPVTDGEYVVPVVSSGTNGHSSTPSDPGILRVSVLDAKDLIGGLDVKPYAVVRIGEKEFKTKHAGKTVAPEWYVCSRTLEPHLFALGMRPLISLLDPQPPNSTSQSLITRPLGRIRRWGT